MIHSLQYPLTIQASRFIVPRMKKFAVRDNPIDVVVTLEGLENVRKSLGLSQKDFAALIGVAENTYGKLRRGPVQVRLGTIAKILSHTTATIADLFIVHS